MLALDTAITMPRARTDRRTYHRHPVWFPVQIDADDLGKVIGVTRDVSVKGMLLQTNANLFLGAPVKLTFRVQTGGEPVVVEATVVRGGENDVGDWPYQIAVEFDEALENLESALREEARVDPLRLRVA